MSKRANPNTLLFMLVFLLAMVGTTFAEPSLLLPAHVGLKYEYNRRDSDEPVNEWTVLMEFDHQETIDSLTYFHLQRWNYYNDGAWEDLGYARSTEEAVYMYDPSGAEDLVFQMASVGTEWSYQMSDGDYQVREIIAIEPVTIPYGTFDTAYVHRNYTCVDPDDLSQGQSTYSYEWMVPGVGFVKGVNDWGDNPLLTMELVDVIIASNIDIDSDTLNLQSKAKWIKCYISLPAGYDVADIDPESIFLNGEVAPDRCRVNKARQMMIVRFYRSEVQAIVEPGEVELTISGELNDGTKFEGSDTITVID